MKIFWTALESVGSNAPELPKALYARENALSPAANTVELDVKQVGASGSSGGGRFWAASANGARVFFTDCHRLTANATAVANKGCSHTPPPETETDPNPQQVFTGNDLYEYDFEKPEGQRLTDLSVDSAHTDPLGADVQGVVGASEDGTYVYFIADGALAPGAERRICKRPLEEKPELSEHGELTNEVERRLEKEQSEEDHGTLPPGRGCNLYVSHSGGAPVLIVALAAADDHLERLGGAQAGGSGWLGDWRPSLENRTAEVTADGRHLVFESTQRLTGYDNTALDEQGQDRGVEVFVFSAEPNERGHLDCASCNPTGASAEPEDAQGTRIGGGTYLPISMNPTYLPRWISQDGDRVFFDSSQSLVPGDTNGVQDVYEWEAPGEGSCSAAGASAVNGGCLYLLTGGTSTDYSYFLEADVRGANVFFTHRGEPGSLDAADERTQVFDARVNGGFETAPAVCATTSTCPASSSEPTTFSSPPTAVLMATGQVTPPPPSPIKLRTAAQIKAEQLAKALKICRHMRNKSERASCDRIARRRYGTAPKARRKGRSNVHRSSRGKR
jgi:hypothetical protein